MLKPLWTPSAERVTKAAMTDFRRQASAHTGRELSDSTALHDWSVAAPADFWAFYSKYAKLPFKSEARQVMSDDPMPYTKWFEGATLNYAEALLYPPDVAADTPALIAVNETGEEHHLSYAELRHDVARCAAALRREGVGQGDRVAAYICNLPEALITLLACASLGAVFSSCSPDFGPEAALARFGQIQPKLLVASSHYHYNGKPYNTLPTVKRLAEGLKSLSRVVLVGGETSDLTSWSDWLGPSTEPTFTPLPFDHPLYILYSSGTTGLPKAIVHRAGGALLTHHKEHLLHSGIRGGDVLFYFTTCGWMMWNWLVSGLAQGATLVLYDGSPTYPEAASLWRLAEKLRFTHFGASARFIHACRAAGLKPGQYDLSSLEAILSTGSPLSPVGFEWVYENVKADVHLASISGGTDIVSCFMLGDPTRPVYAGQIQGPGLGVDLAAYDEAGKPVTEQPGELVCRGPLPSMPLSFWNDLDFKRYQAAYLETYPGVWRHGDLIEITPEGIIIYGRSDATLNPAGVRIGTAEIYRPLEALPEITEALAVGKREGNDEGNNEVIWLFVVLRPGEVLDDDLRRRIKAQIRTQSSPRHVPGRILQVTDLPRTRSGKLTEIAVARLVNGQSVPNREAMANPEALDEMARAIEPPTARIRAPRQS
jgi:acetoacetyl-CoA synthetase